MIGVASLVRQFRMEYCRTEDMVVDMMTKALGHVKLQKFVYGSGLREW